MKKQNQELVDQEQIIKDRMHRICILKQAIEELQNYVNAVMAQRNK